MNQKKGGSKMNESEEYVYICNNGDCEEIHESHTTKCDSCNSDTRAVHRSDIDMMDEEIEGI